jgi:hypothetical protein
MGDSTSKTTTFINPIGLIEQRAIGPQTGVTVRKNIEELVKLIKVLRRQHKPVLVLIDITGVTKNNLASHKAVVTGMLEVPCDLAAFYGPISLQVLVNMLSIVADKSKTIRAFSNRDDALSWLKKGTK